MCQNASQKHFPWDVMWERQQLETTVHIYPMCLLASKLLHCWGQGSLSYPNYLPQYMFYPGFGQPWHLLLKNLSSESENKIKRAFKNKILNLRLFRSKCWMKLGLRPVPLTIASFPMLSNLCWLLLSDLEMCCLEQVSASLMMETTGYLDYSIQFTRLPTLLNFQKQLADSNTYCTTNPAVTRPEK